MNINEFASYLLDRDTDKAQKLYYELDSEVSCCDVNTILNIIAEEGDADSCDYSYAELLEWLNDDSDAYDNVNAVISCNTYTDFHTLLEAAKHDQDKDQYNEVYYELEKMLNDFDGDDELDEVADTPKTYESILDAL